MTARPNEGRAFLYYGNGGDGGLVRALQQRNRNNTRPISLLGRTAPNGLFHLRAEFPRNLARFSWATGASPSAWLEWEVKPLGVAFDGAGIQQGTPQSLVPAGGTVIFEELALATEGISHLHFTRALSYHWRARVATNNPLFPHTAFTGSLSTPELRNPRIS